MRVWVLVCMFYATLSVASPRECAQYFNGPKNEQTVKSRRASLPKESQFLTKGITSDRALRHSYEDQKLESNLKNAETQRSLWTKISSFFTGKKSSQEMIEKFGSQWESLFEGRVVDLTRTMLDSESLSSLSDKIQERSYIDLEANWELRTQDVLKIIATAKEVLGLNLFMLWRVNTAKVLDAILQKQPQIRELVIDQFANADFKTALQLKELRVLDISNSRMGEQGVVHYMGRVFNSPLTEISAEVRYITVEGVIDFLRRVKAPVTTKRGKETVENPHFKKIILPHLDSTQYIQIKEVARELGILLYYQSVHKNPYFSGKYEDVPDGDTFKTMPSRVEPKRWDRNVRMWGIDAADFKISAAQEAKESAAEKKARLILAGAARAFVFYHKKHATDELLVDTTDIDRSGRPVVIDFLKIQENHWSKKGPRANVKLKVNGLWIDLAQELYLNGLVIRYEYEGQSREANQGEGFSWLAHYKKYKSLIDPWYKLHEELISEK